MRNVFLFLKRYSVLIFFLFLQGTALYMLFSYNTFHNTIYTIFSSEVSGKVFDRVNNVEEYLSLKKENQSLRLQNAALLSRLPSGLIVPDSTFSFVVDTLKNDSISVVRQFEYMPAKVISNSVFLQQNYIMLHRGSDQGVLTNMAVVGPDGIIGTVIGTIKNMSIVMSLLHRQSKLIAVMKNGSGLGEVTWDGKDPAILSLNKIPKTVNVKKGDTVITSPYSDRFPPGMPIGYVEEVDQDQATNTYILKVRTSTDFYSIQHAYVVKNILEEEVQELKRKLIKE
jgi:rod shape-determining protein MreC